MKWETTDPTEAAIAIAIVLVVFTSLQTLCEFFFFGSRSPQKIKKNLKNRKWAILVGLIVAGAFSLAVDGGFFLFLFACYLLFSWWFSCWLALQLSNWLTTGNSGRTRRRS